MSCKGLGACASMYSKRLLNLRFTRAIAAQCPTTAGGGVIAAIYMLPAEERPQWLPQEETGLMGVCNRASTTDHLPVASLKLSPNPATDLLSVELPGQTSASWEVSNLEGRILLTGKVQDQQQFWVPTGTLAGGVYLLRIRAGLAVPLVQKFVISK